ncbi:hypothetical protein ACFL2O_02545, partial [Thermodesulfobacteriota bacterium]
DEFEHVTKYFYRNKEKFYIFNFQYEKNFSDIQLSVDTKQDMDAFNAIILNMKRPHWEYSLPQILDIYLSMAQTINMK